MTKLSTAAAAALLVLCATISSAAVSPRIVNGLTTHDFPTTGALLYATGGVPIDADNAALYCSGTLVGCHSFLTAAHCIAGDGDPSHYAVFLQNVGSVAVSSVASHPSYDGAHSGHDVAIVTLATDVTGIAPTPVNSTHDLAVVGVGLAGTIVGFGQTVVPGTDYGVKRFGAVQTANCATGSTGGEGNDKLVCWDFAIPVGPPGQDSDTCNGDSGGPLFIDFAGNPEVAGVTSSGSSPFCRPLDHSWDASVYYNAAWIAGELATDSTAACGGIGPVGSAAAVVVGNDGTLSGAHLTDAFVVDVPANASVLRVALNGRSNHIFDPDFYVKYGPGASTTSYDCKADGLSPFGACEFLQPAAGAWSLFVADASGAGEYQLTTTIFAVPVPVSCGDGTVGGDEQCDDGAANGTAASCCSATCTFQPGATACADDGNPCTVDLCNGTSAVCEHGAGNPGVVCRSAVDACDVTETCDGITASCPGDGRVADHDGDGLCDAIDPCTNVAHGQDFLPSRHPRITLRRINVETHPGNDTIALDASFQLGLGETFATLDPSAHGTRLVLRDASNTSMLVDVVLPAGAFAGPGSRGWRLNAKRTTWTYSDATRSLVDGITQMQIQDGARKLPRQVRVTLRGRDGTYPVTADDQPLRVAVALGDASDATAGRCGESAFVPADCSFTHSGEALVCRR